MSRSSSGSVPSDSAVILKLHHRSWTWTRLPPLETTALHSLSAASSDAGRRGHPCVSPGWFVNAWGGDFKHRKKNSLNHMNTIAAGLMSPGTRTDFCWCRVTPAWVKETPECPSTLRCDTPNHARSAVSGSEVIFRSTLLEVPVIQLRLGNEQGSGVYWFTFTDMHFNYCPAKEFNKLP